MIAPRLAPHALDPFPPGPLHRVGHDDLWMEVAPDAGGRIARLVYRGVDWLHRYRADDGVMIGWGCFPMLPWAGRIRDGRFAYQGHDYRLPPNLGAHAIHGVGFSLPWQIVQSDAGAISLAAELPRDSRWPFGGGAMQRLVIEGDALLCEIEVSATFASMPCVIGWHPWFPKPDRVEFNPGLYYPRDDEGIATRPLAPPRAPPWDDCFINQRPVQLHRGAQTLRLTSDCGHWVVYDERSDVSCFEPQSGPPDAFTLEPFAHALPLGGRRRAWMRWEWSEDTRR